MNKYVIDGASITDWEAFHDLFSREFEFPNYYGRNMNAWIDCMSDLCGSGEIIVLHIDNIDALRKANIEIYDALIECSAFVNWRFTEEDTEPLIALSFFN